MNTLNTAVSLINGSLMLSKMINLIPENNSNSLFCDIEETNPTFSKNQLQIISEKYPNQVPIIISKCQSSSLMSLEKRKYVVYRKVYISEFKYLIQKKIKLPPNQAMFFFTDNFMIDNNMTIGDIFDKKNVDGILYIQYTNENAFG
jgi:hypothetical protein